MGKLRYFFFASCVLYLCYYYKQLKLKLAYPEVGYTIDELVKFHGFSLEHHYVTTKDGYILELHRIPSQSELRKPPIFIMHGFIQSSITFLTFGNNSIPYHLSKLGYDVWLGNARGNAYSRRHISINPDINPKQFFDYSWHEIGSIDLPSMIDYILTTTKHKTLIYTGHSQGCISFYVMMSEHPEYNQKVNLMVAFAPVVYTKNIRSLTFTIPAKLQSFLEWFSPVIGFYEIAPRHDIWTWFGNTFCYDGAWTQQFCTAPIRVTCGFNDRNFNKTLLPLFYSHTPAGSSLKQLLHFTQVLNSDVFRQYDHGASKNLIKYKQETPPLYYLNRTTAPVAIFWGENDWLTNKRNIKILEESLPNVIYTKKMGDKFFNHLDFFMSQLSVQLLYPDLKKLIKKFSNPSTQITG